MTNTFTLAARRASAKPVELAIAKLEASINMSFVNAGELLAAIGNARLDRRSQMDLTVGMEASETAALAVGALASSYRHTVGTHFHLAKDKAVLGLASEPKAWGDIQNTFDTLDTDQMASAGRRLGLVSADEPGRARAAG